MTTKGMLWEAALPRRPWWGSLLIGGVITASAIEHASMSTGSDDREAAACGLLLVARLMSMCLLLRYGMGDLWGACMQERMEIHQSQHRHVLAWGRVRSGTRGCDEKKGIDVGN